MKGLFKKYEDRFVAAFFLLITVVYASQIPMIKRTKISPLSSAFLPTVVAVGMGILTVCQIYQAWKKMKAPVAEDAETEAESSPENAPDYNRVGLTIGAALLYVLALKPVGFVVSSVIYLAVQMGIMAPQEERKPVKFLLISAVTSVVIYLIFHNVLSLMLPNGILSGIL